MAQPPRQGPVGEHLWIVWGRGSDDQTEKLCTDVTGKLKGRWSCHGFATKGQFVVAFAKTGARGAPVKLTDKIHEELTNQVNLAWAAGVDPDAVLEYEARTLMRADEAFVVDVHAPKGVLTVLGDLQAVTYDGVLQGDDARWTHEFAEEAQPMLVVDESNRLHIVGGVYSVEDVGIVDGPLGILSPAAQQVGGAPAPARKAAPVELLEEGESCTTFDCSFDVFAARFPGLVHLAKGLDPDVQVALMRIAAGGKIGVGTGTAKISPDALAALLKHRQQGVPVPLAENVGAKRKAGHRADAVATATGRNVASTLIAFGPKLGINVPYSVLGITPGNVKRLVSRLSPDRLMPKARTNPHFPGRLGTGQRFAECVEEMSKRPGVYSPEGLCAAIGRRKYGRKKFAQLARAGRRNPAGVGVEVMGHDFKIANPDDVEWTDGALAWWFGSVGMTRIITLGTSYEDGLEIAAAYLADHVGPGFFEAPDYEQAGMQLEDRLGRPFDPDNRHDEELLREIAETDLVYTESGWIPSWEVHVSRLHDEDLARARKAALTHLIDEETGDAFEMNGGRSNPYRTTDSMIRTAVSPTMPEGLVSKGLESSAATHSGIGRPSVPMGLVSKGLESSAAPPMDLSWPLMPEGALVGPRVPRARAPQPLGRRNPWAREEQEGDAILAWSQPEHTTKAGRLKDIAQTAEELAQAPPPAKAQKVKTGLPIHETPEALAQRMTRFTGRDQWLPRLQWAFSAENIKGLDHGPYMAATDGHRIAFVPQSNLTPEALRGIERKGGAGRTWSQLKERQGDFPESSSYKFPLDITTVAVDYNDRRKNYHWNMDAGALRDLAESVKRHGGRTRGLWFTPMKKGKGSVVRAHPKPDKYEQGEEVAAASEALFVESAPTKAIKGAPLLLDPDLLLDALKGAEGTVQLLAPKSETHFGPVQLARADGEHHVIMPRWTHPDARLANRLAHQMVTGEAQRAPESAKKLIQFEEDLREARRKRERERAEVWP